MYSHSRRAINPIRINEYGFLEKNEKNTPIFRVIDTASLSLESKDDGQPPYPDNAESLLETNRYLGLHKEGARLRALHYVGAVWLDDTEQRIPFLVDPKIHDDNQMLDAVAMLDNAAQYSRFFDASEESANDYKIFTLFDDQEEIAADFMVPEVSLFQAVWYILALASFCQRSLRQGFIKVDENLVGKVKGRILVSKQVVSNNARGRADRTFCRYETMTIDTLANRILRYALRLATAFLNQNYSKRVENVWLWARQAETTLSGVTLTKIWSSDFRDIRYGGSLLCYKPIHHLAKAIITSMRLDADGKVISTGAVMPFAINMNTLFEAFIGGKFQEAGFDLIPQKRLPVKFGHTPVEFRPDYCSPCGRLVVDAKYKNYLTGADERVKEDLMQLLTYSTLVPKTLGYDKIPLNLVNKVPHNERWALIVVPKISKDKVQSIKIADDGFPVHAGEDLQSCFPLGGKLRVAQVECPVPAIKRFTTCPVPTSEREQR